MTSLQTRLLKAHSDGNSNDLVQLYIEAADTASNDEASGFFLTHAYVFALEAGLPETDTLRQRLIDMGRETPV